ncbi:MAG: U32 family peptidase, partial [Chthoniobacterales bacterium]
PVTASVFLKNGVSRLTISYDLTAGQVLALAKATPAQSLELTIHQHMPMFHMEHCVFAAFLSNGKDYTDCGRPCEKHRVHLRDRVGVEHPLRADVGCRNTLFNSSAQTGAKFFPQFDEAGIRHFRVELLEEDQAETLKIVRAYRSLLSGQKLGRALWHELRAIPQLGVTQGTL